ncbi:hypothetical protein ACFLRI_00690 [Bacteroidota bacterium]
MKKQSALKLALLMFSFTTPFLGISPSVAQTYDMTISISDKMINKVLTAVGAVSDKDEYQLLLIKGTYTWKVENAFIKLEEDKALFIADVIVETGPFHYADKVSGLLDVTYNAKTNKLELQLTHAHLKIKTKILGAEKLITTVDLAKYYKTPFVFDGPLSYQDVFEFELPDGSKKKISTIVTSCLIKVNEGAILMKANFKIQDASLNVKPVEAVVQQDEELKKNIQLKEDREKESKKERRERKKAEKTK